MGRLWQNLKINHKQVSNRTEELLVWQVSYLSGALDVISGICEIVVCLFFTHRLQLEIKQKYIFAEFMVKLLWDVVV